MLYIRNSKYSGIARRAYLEKRSYAGTGVFNLKKQTDVYAWNRKNILF